jgi:hypothetical protein
MSYRRILGRARAKRTLIMLAVSGLLGLAGVIAGTTVPASAADGVWTVTLSASPTTLAPITRPTLAGVGSVLTATANQPVQGTGFEIEIYNFTTGDLATKPCMTGEVCTVTTDQNTAGTDAYVAYVAGPSQTNVPPDIQAESGTSYVTWTASPYQISVGVADPINEGSAFVTATVTGGDIATSPYFIEIYDETTGQLLNPETGCGGAQTCTASFTPTLFPNNIIAFVMPASASYPPSLGGIQASSNVAVAQLILN